MFQRLRDARDYNQALPRPVRRLHLAFAPFLALCDQISGIGSRSNSAQTRLISVRRGQWAWPMLLGLIGFIFIWPYDRSLSDFFTYIGRSLGGDLRRELHAWQQFGAVGSIVFVCLVMFLADRDRARRLLDLLLAIAIAGLLCTAMKMGVGRPRPREYFEDPHTFLGPLGVYPVPIRSSVENASQQPIVQYKLVHAWESLGSPDLWSMPSSHTLYAVVLAIFLIAVYPRLKWLWIALAALVGICRLIFDAHWPTDVIVGAALGAAVGQVIIGRWFGVRMLDRLWRVLIDPAAQPALPRLEQAFREIGKK